MVVVLMLIRLLMVILIGLHWGATGMQRHSNTCMYTAMTISIDTSTDTTSVISININRMPLGCHFKFNRMPWDADAGALKCK